MNVSNVASSKKRWLKWSLLTVGVMALLGAGLAVLTRDLPIPKPSGPYGVGFTETELQTTGGASSRVLALDIWYPARTTEGHAAEPYTTALLNREIAKSMNLPAVLGTITPSYSFRNAPVLEGQHPVVVFNHGFASFTRQNFSNFQELASHGYLVISIGHPGDSLVSRGAQGQPILLNTQSPDHLAVMEAQKDLNVFLDNHANLLEQQRKARDFPSYLQVSQQLAQIAPFLQLNDRMDRWIQDTQGVLDALQTHPQGILSHANAKQVVLMGHSLGGVVTQHFAQHPSAGIQGIINLDAPFIQRDQTWTEMQVPSLNLLSTHNTMKGRDLSLAGTLDPLFQHSSAGSHVIEVPNTAHYNFTDLNHVQALRFTPMLGKVEGLKMERWLNTAVLTFLQRLNDPHDPVTLQQPLLNDPEVHEVFFRPRRSHD